MRKLAATSRWWRSRGIDVALDFGARHVRAIAAHDKKLVELPAYISGRGPRFSGSTTSQGEMRVAISDDRIVDLDLWSHIAATATKRAHAHAKTIILARPLDLGGPPISQIKRALEQHHLDVAYEVPAHIAAAIGCDLPIGTPHPSVIVHVGMSRCEVAVITLGGTVVHRSCRAGTAAWDHALHAILRRDGGVTMSMGQMRKMREEVCDLSPNPTPRQYFTTAHKLDNGEPVDITIDGHQLAIGLNDLITQIVDTIRDTFRETPPELCADILDHGIFLTGGGALQRGLEARLQAALSLPVSMAPTPTLAVLHGLQTIAGDTNLQATLHRAAA